MFKKVQHGAVILGLLLPLATHALSCRAISEGGISLAKCDASFINPPIFGDLCQGATLTGIYTLRNDTPRPLKINYIRIQDNDPLPGAATAIIPTPGTGCVVGSFLAPGATCNISVELLPLAAGTFNRVLQVGIDTRQVEIDAPAITSLVSVCTLPSPIPPPDFIPPVPVPPVPGFPPVPGVPPQPLFSTSILGASTVTNTGATVVNGNLDLTPGSSVTGFPPGVVVNGAININNAHSTATKTQASAYFTGLNALPCNFSFGPGDTVITQTMLNTNGPGVYCFASSAQIATNLNIPGLVGQSYTFKIGSTLTTATGTIVTTSGGILNDSISWAVGSSATLGVGSTFHGIIDALTSITLNNGATLDGRAWALNGAVTLDTNQVNPAAP
ncbi:TPA: ice-binding family protein [Legionella bozemanae]|uniref:ice-binding family protein n=1 Tax=Legionella bozemanae TaxID=447 RepID=UPI00399D111A